MYQFFPIEAAENGKNAFFIVENKLIGHNQIHINTKKLGTAGFHEIGHSINYNTSKLYRNNWSNLWTQKMDYFEYHLYPLL